MALVEASKILRKHLNPFVQYFELGSDTVSDDAMTALRDASRATIDPELQQKLNMTVQELDLSVRANNCLESAKIGTVRDLVKKTDTDLLKVRSFGKTSLREVKRKLADMGLSLGMDLDAPSAATMPDDDDWKSDELDQSEEGVGAGAPAKWLGTGPITAALNAPANLLSRRTLQLKHFNARGTVMRHMIRGRQLSRDTEHRKALRRNLVQSLFEHGKVRTTLPKAKEVQAMAEKLITLARDNNVNNRRRVSRSCSDRRLVDKEQEFTGQT